MSEKENKLQQQGRRPKKAGIGKLPGKKKETFRCNWKRCLWRC